MILERLNRPSSSRRRLKSSGKLSSAVSVTTRTQKNGIFHSIAFDATPAASISTAAAPLLRSSDFSRASEATRSTDSRTPLFMPALPSKAGVLAGKRKSGPATSLATKISHGCNAASSPPQKPVLTKPVNSTFSRATAAARAANFGPGPFDASIAASPRRQIRRAKSTGQSSLSTLSAFARKPSNSRLSAAINANN